MKTIAKLAGSLFGFLTMGLILAATAVAQTYPPPTGLPTEATEKTGAAQPAAGEVAFTGLELTAWIAIIVALVAVGAVLVILGRRRAASARAE